MSPQVLAQQANEGSALSRFEPAPAGDRMFGVASPYTAGELTPHVMVLADYAHNPLVLRREADDEVAGAVIGDQLILHLNASLALWRRVTVDLNVPLAVLQSGDNPSAGGMGAASPTGAALGDLRLGARVALLGEYHDAFQLAVGGRVWLPTGSRDAYLSDGAIRAAPQLIVGGRIDALVWSFAASPQFRPTRVVPGGEQGTTLQWGGGIGFLLAEGRLQVGPELSMELGLVEPSVRSFNSELLLGARYRILPDIEAGLGAGPGLTGAAGTPDFRGVAMLAWTSEQRGPRDGDGDGVADERDACPDVPGVQSEDASKNGCPALKDRDGDGIGDAQDACPDFPGVQSEDAAKNGCPSDKDGDGIADERDACPDVPGVQSADAAKNGCPGDKDGDGIPDAKDACPEIPGPPDEDPRMNGCPKDDRDKDGIPDAIDMCPNEKGLPSANLDEHGCPKTVRVTTEEVRLLQQIQFDFDSARIKPISDPILDDITQALKDHPEILHVEVQGHTDESGTKAYNRSLSQRRAEAVRQALIKRSIDPDRLSAKGYGRDVPLNNNETEEGRQTNRRVQFKIVQTTTRKP
ncbi:OmpA family protein [Chondromyces crocatus]|uniref:OmpA family protein n=1 Tax=Chondromyces crocatus TaxID=52 RepID=UPI001FE0C702|nr:OmpA family protein [Chondromyces crocatus]